MFVNGTRHSVWFDLYLVTRLVNDPALKKAKQDLMESPAGRKIEAQMRKVLFGGAAAPKRSGCLGVILLTITATTILATLIL